jgi:hypothetical protein
VEAERQEKLISSQFCVPTHHTRHFAHGGASRSYRNDRAVMDKGIEMTNIPIVDLFLSILFGSLIASFIFDTHRNLFVQRKLNIVQFIVVYGAFVATVYGIPIYLGRLLPDGFTLIIQMAISTIISIVCLFLGYGIDQYFGRFRKRR